jgi:hypothetical protein
MTEAGHGLVSSTQKSISQNIIFHATENWVLCNPKITSGLLFKTATPNLV